MSVSLGENTSHFLLAAVQWYKPHLNKNMIGKPAQLWCRSAFEVGALHSFLPVQMLKCRCAYTVSTINAESVQWWFHWLNNKFCHYAMVLSLFFSVITLTYPHILIIICVANRIINVIKLPFIILLYYYSNRYGVIYTLMIHTGIGSKLCANNI